MIFVWKLDLIINKVYFNFDMYQMLSNLIVI